MILQDFKGESIQESTCHMCTCILKKPLCLDYLPVLLT